MTLFSTNPKCKLMKNFAALGPYLRESQCEQGRFFFDCLAVCVNVKHAPEKREFWGWWVELESKDECFTYIYSLGLFNHEGNWQAKKIDSPEIQEKLEHTLRDFHKRLYSMLITMNFRLEPAKNFIDLPLPLPA